MQQPPIQKRRGGIGVENNKTGREERERKRKEEEEERKEKGERRRKQKKRKEGREEGRKQGEITDYCRYKIKQEEKKKEI
jgi:hypothetical protein